MMDASDLTHRPTWKHCLITSFAVCGLSALLVIWRPIWISPPSFRYTVFLYLPIAWAGVSVLVVGAFHRPVGKAWIGAAGILVHILLSLLLTVVLVLLFAFGPSDCSTESLAPAIVQHRCNSTFFYSGTGFTFVSFSNFPLMFLTSSSSFRTSSFG